MKILEKIMWFIWQLPQNLVALVMLPFLGKLTYLGEDNSAWIFIGTKMRGGISLGNFIFLSPYLGKKSVYVKHELGHVVDSHKFGWFYLFVIGIPSIMWAWLGDDNKCYYSFYTERWANRNAGLTVKGDGRGCYLVDMNEDE